MTSLRVYYRIMFDEFIEGIPSLKWCEVDVYYKENVLISWTLDLFLNSLFVAAVEHLRTRTPSPSWYIMSPPLHYGTFLPPLHYGTFLHCVTQFTLLVNYVSPTALWYAPSLLVHYVPPPTALWYVPSLHNTFNFFTFSLAMFHAFYMLAEC